MAQQFSRTEMLIGKHGIETLKKSWVAVFGIGGVGSYTAEALARAGVGKLTLIDYDKICETNINRQLHALHSTVGQVKVEVMAKRLLDINPKLEIEIYPEFLGENNSNILMKADYDYIVDAIDTVTAKLLLVEKANQMGIRVVASMGAGNKLTANSFEVVDISETKNCPLAKVMRRELRKRNIHEGLKVVYSPEPPITPLVEEHNNANSRRKTPASISFVPAVAGLLLAGEVINDLLIGHNNLDK